MAAVAVGHVNSGSTCFSAAIFPDWAELDGQTAQQVGRMTVVLDVRELLSPQAAAICGRRREGAQARSQSPVRPALPARLVQPPVQGAAS
jgi:hypothetical protein